MTDAFHSGARAFGALLEVSTANAEGRAPSGQAVRVLAEGFEQWLAADGAQTLDQVFGFAAEGRGKTPHLQKLRGRMRELFIRHLVAVLRAGGFTLDDAAEAVSVAVNDSKDPRFRKQLAVLGALPAPRQREGVGALAHLPPRSVKELFAACGGDQWARFAGYYGEDCEERRKLPQLARAPLSDARVQENLNFLHEITLCERFGWRTVEALKRVIPADALSPEVRAQFL
jgi:hypothetical protein